MDPLKQHINIRATAAKRKENANISNVCVIYSSFEWSIALFAYCVNINSAGIKKNNGNVQFVLLVRHLPSLRGSYLE